MNSKGWIINQKGRDEWRNRVNREMDKKEDLNGETVMIGGDLTSVPSFFNFRIEEHVC